jgi:hypothetical protein
MPRIDEGRDRIANGSNVVAFEKHDSAAQPGHVELQPLNPSFQGHRQCLGLHVSSTLLRKNNDLHDRVHRCRLSRQATLEPGLQAISENAKRLAVVRSRTGERGSK